MHSYLLRVDWNLLVDWHWWLVVETGDWWLKLMIGGWKWWLVIDSWLDWFLTALRFSSCSGMSRGSEKMDGNLRAPHCHHTLHPNIYSGEKRLNQTEFHLLRCKTQVQTTMNFIHSGVNLSNQPEFCPLRCKTQVQTTMNFTHSGVNLSKHHEFYPLMRRRMPESWFWNPQNKVKLTFASPSRNFASSESLAVVWEWTRGQLKGHEIEIESVELPEQQLRFEERRLLPHFYFHSNNWIPSMLSKL